MSDSRLLQENPEPIKLVPAAQRDVWMKPRPWRCEYIDGRGRCTSRELLTGLENEDPNMGALAGMLKDWLFDNAAALLDAAGREGELRETLAWVRMAMGWAVFRDDSRVWISNEMRDIHERLDAALTEEPW